MRSLIRSHPRRLEWCHQWNITLWDPLNMKRMLNGWTTITFRLLFLKRIWQLYCYICYFLYLHISFYTFIHCGFIVKTHPWPLHMTTVVAVILAKMCHNFKVLTGFHLPTWIVFVVDPFNHNFKRENSYMVPIWRICSIVPKIHKNLPRSC